MIIIDRHKALAQTIAQKIRAAANRNDPQACQALNDAEVIRNTVLARKRVAVRRISRFSSAVLTIAERDLTDEELASVAMLTAFALLKT